MNEQTWTKEPRLLRMEPSRLLSSKYMQSRRVDEAKPSARSSQASDSLVSTRRTLRLVCSGWSLQTRYREFFPLPPHRRLKKQRYRAFFPPSSHGFHRRCDHVPQDPLPYDFFCQTIPVPSN